MSWARYDDELPMNRKVVALRAHGLHGTAALGLHLLANTWCRHNGTGGRVPAHVPEVLVGKDGAKLAGILCAVGMFDADDDGWMIHDYAEFHDPKDPNPDRSAADRKKDLSAKRSQAGKMGAANRWQTDGNVTALPLAKSRQVDSPVPVPSKKTAVAISSRRPNPVWDALSDAFGVPGTKSEQANRGRQVKELTEAGATAEDVAARVREHGKRRLNWTLTANALVTHWTELDPAKNKRSEGRWDPDTQAWLAPGL